MTGFFVLSGFLNYDVNGAKDFSELKEIRKFWLKRLISIFPAYYFGALLYIITWGKESLIQNIILAPIELLAIQNIFPNMFGITHNGGTWFISCILICHFIFPYLSSIIKQLNVKMRIISIGILVLVLLYAPLITYFFELGSIYDNPFMRGGEFTIGMLLASLKDELYKLKVLTYPMALIAEFAILIIGVEYVWQLRIQRNNYMLYSWISLPAFICMIVTFSGLDMRNNKIISYFGMLSYSFFVAQLFIWPIMRKIISLVGYDNNVLKILSSFVVCWILAIGIYELIEKPSKKIFGRFIRLRE